MASKTPYIDAVSASLPSVMSDLLLSFDVYAYEQLDTLVRFCLGGTCPPRIQGHSDAWQSGQSSLKRRFQQLEPQDQALGKRERDIDGLTNGSAKKQKVIDDSGADGEALYTLHALSVTSPVRKKVDILITPSSIRLTSPSTGALEARIPLSALSRAFLVSTLGKNKNKPQWSVVLLSADTADKKDADSTLQVAFAIDHAVGAAKDAFATSKGGGARRSHAKGTETRTHLETFLSHLPQEVELLSAPDPGVEVQPFMSRGGQPYVDAYLGAREGSLYFLSSGILWTGSKPYEYFALEDLAPDSDEPGQGGIKMLSATGRTFSLYIRRRGRPVSGEEHSTNEEEMLDEGEETEYAMIDGHEQENVMQWVRKYRRLFGQPREVAKPSSLTKDTGAQLAPNGKGKGKARAEDVVEEEKDSDVSDEDYEAPSETDGGEPSSESESDDGEGGGRDDESEDEAEDSEEEVRGEGAGIESEEDEEELNPARHPLMRPGAMPRMSKAAMDAAVRMVVGDLAGPSDEEEEEEDQLE